MDTFHPNIQNAQIPLGPAGGTFGQLPGRHHPRDRAEEAEREGGDLLQGPHEGRHDAASGTTVLRHDHTGRQRT